MSDAKPQFERVNRRRVAREEIDTAIDLFFNRKSAIAVNLLSWAANDVLRGLAKEQSKDTFHAVIEENIREEKVKEWRSIIRDPYTFSKHSDRDPDRELDKFDPEIVHFSIIAPVVDYRTIFGQSSLPMALYQSWFWSRYPSFLKEGVIDTILPNRLAIFGSGAPLYIARQMFNDLMGDKTIFHSIIPPEAIKYIEL